MEVIVAPGVTAQITVDQEAIVRHGVAGITYPEGPPTNLLFLLGPSYWCFYNFPNYYQLVEDQVCRTYSKPTSIHLSIQNGD